LRRSHTQPLGAARGPEASEEDWNGLRIARPPPRQALRPLKFTSLIHWRLQPVNVQPAFEMGPGVPDRGRRKCLK
jgi:hypothetical protein